MVSMRAPARLEAGRHTKAEHGRGACPNPRAAHTDAAQNEAQENDDVAASAKFYKAAKY